MSEVQIVGYGLHPFGRFPDLTAADMVAVAVGKALDMAGLQPRDVQAVYTGHGLSDSGGGTAVALEAGIGDAPVYNLDAACASSSVAMTLGASAIQSEQWDTVLVIGYEKMGRGMLRSARAHDPFGDSLGLETQPAQYALKAKWYMEKYGVSREALASISLKSRSQALLNPNAHIREHVTLDDVLNSPMVADPLTRFQCSPTSDGASAIVLRRKRPSAEGAVELRAWRVGNQMGHTQIEGGLDDTTTRELAQHVYEAAGVGPGDIGVAQVHDAFTPGEALRVEALGLIPDGEAANWTLAGRTWSTGDMPVNTDGGLISRGHPLGATGLAQVIELVTQLRGEAGERQVHPVPTAAAHQNSGGGENSATVVSLLTR